MKVSILSTYDRANGSARAAYRLHQGLKEKGVTSHMLVQGKQSSDTQVIAGPKSKLAQGAAQARVSLDGLPLKLYRQRQSILLSLQWLPSSCANRVNRTQSDIVNLHWANDGYLPIEDLAKLRAPVVWSLHDMWAFTGGCHYTQGCDRYLQSCGACPQLGSDRNQDLSRWVWNRKQKAWRNANVTIVGLSNWMSESARASSLFRDTRIETIHNGIDTTAYKPLDQATARALLNLPADKPLVLFGALNSTGSKRKGFQFLQPALVELSNSTWANNLKLVVFGANRPEVEPDFGFKTHYLGTLADDLTLALAYSAADVFVAPSIQENLANTVVEALACGTPCVAFNIGGMPDMIEHHKNGYLATPFETSELAQGIRWVLDDSDRRARLKQRAREKIEQEFTLEIQANRYTALFEDLL